MAPLTIEFRWSGPPRIPRSANVLVREALLPMLMWPTVPVTRRIDQELTVVDQFIVEAALALEPMRAEDVEEVTSIPRDAVTRIAGRLTGLGLLRMVGSEYHAIEDRARAALEERTVPRYDTIYICFLYLPEGDDLIAYTPGAGRRSAPMLHRAQPTSIRPTPGESGDRPLRDLLRERIQSRHVADLPDDIVDVGASDVTVPGACPVYRCRGHVRAAGEDATLVLEVISPSGKKQNCVISGAAGQAELWAALAARASEAAETWGSGGTVNASSQAPTRWSFILDGLAAVDAVRASIAVSRPTGLSIAAAPDCVVAVGVTFQPADEDARWVFALDQAVHEVIETEHSSLRPDAVRAAAARARREHGLPDEAVPDAQVEQRLWDDGHFRHVYALREALDFTYD